MVNAITVTLSGIDKAISLRPFQTAPKKDGRVNTYFQVALPKKDGSVYPATRGVSPVRLPHGLDTAVKVEGHRVPTTAGKTSSGNSKVSGKLGIEVDGKPMVANVEISDLGKGNFWVRFSVVNVSNTFSAETPESAEAKLFAPA